MQDWISLPSLKLKEVDIEGSPPSSCIWRAVLILLLTLNSAAVLQAYHMRHSRIACLPRETAIASTSPTFLNGDAWTDKNCHLK